LKFKVVVKIEDLQDVNELKGNLSILNDYGIPVGYETLGSVFGSHYRNRTQNLKHTHSKLTIGSVNFKQTIKLIKAPTIYKEDYKNLIYKFVETLTEKESIHLQRVFDPSRKDFKPLSEISNEIDVSFEFIENLNLKAIKDKKNFFNSYLRDNIHLVNFKALEETPVEAQEINVLNPPQNKHKDDLNYLSPKQKKNLIKAKLSQTEILQEKVQRTQKLILSKNNAEIQEVESLQKLTISLNIILIIKEIVSFCKLEFGLNFRFKDLNIDLDLEISEIPENLNQIQLDTNSIVSNCIHIPSDPDDRVVTMFINPCLLIL